MNSPRDMADLVWKSLGENQEQLKSKPAVLAFSGGKDSTAVLHLYQIWVQNQWVPKPVVYHLNHRIRDTKKEVQEIQSHLTQCSFLEKVSIRSVDIPKLAKRLQKGMEETGRLVRYHHLRTLARTHRGYLVTGHHCEDYLESVLNHWIRGGGESSLRTLPFLQEGVFRPLLFLTIKQRQILGSGDHAIWEDATNHSDLYLRNRVRKHVVKPLLDMGLDAFKLYWNFHSPSDGYNESKTNPPSFWTWSREELEFLNPSLLKSTLDLGFRVFGLYPITRGRLSEFHHYLQNQKSFEWKEDSYTLCGTSQKKIYLIPKHSPLWKEGMLMPTPETTVFHWNQKSLDLGKGIWKLTRPSMGQRILIRGKSHELKELFRERDIPRLLRVQFPILQLASIEGRESLWLPFSLFSREIKDIRT